MNKLFNNKANLLALGLAAAAIFAVTFAACDDGGTTTNVLPYDFKEGDIVQWVAIGNSGVTKSVIAYKDGLAPLPVAGDYIKKVITPISGYTTGADTITADEGTPFTLGSFYKAVTLHLDTGVWSIVDTKYYKASNTSVLAATGVVEGDLVISVDTTAVAAVTGASISEAAVITKTGAFTPGSYYKAKTLSISTNVGTIIEKYYVAPAGGNTLTATGVGASDILISVETTALTLVSGYAAGSGTLTKSDAFEEDAYYKVGYLVSGEIVEKYFVAVDADELTATGFDGSTVVVSVGAALPLITGYDTSTAAKITKADTFTADNYYKAATLDTTTGKVVEEAYKAASTAELTATGVAANAPVVSVETTPTYTKADYYTFN